MKKLIYSTLSLAIAATIFLTGCKGSEGDEPKPDAPKPTITFESSPGFISANATKLINDAIKFKMVVSHTVNLKSIKITRNYKNTGEVVLLDSTFSNNIKTTQYTLNTLLLGVKGPYVYTFYSTDKDNSMSSKAITVNASGPLTDAIDGTIYSLQASGAGKFSAFDLIEGDAITAGSSAGNEAMRDIVDGSTSATLSKIWKSQNSTTFKVGSGGTLNGKTISQFYTEDDVIAAWNAIGGESNNVAINETDKSILIAKVTRGGTPVYYLIGISEVNDIAGSNDDYIKFNYRY